MERSGDIMTDTAHKIDDCWNHIGVWGRETPRCPMLEQVVHCANCRIYSAAGRQLLDREVSPEYLREGAAQLAREKSRPQSRNTASVVIFRLGEEWFGLPTSLFQEVVGFRKMHRVPHHGNNVLRGLVNIRGELQLCVSLGRLLGIPRGKTHGNDAVNGIYERMIVIARGDARCVFPVSEVRGVRRYVPQDLLSAPATAAHNAGDYLYGMLHVTDKGQERHIGCLNEDVLLAALDRSIS